MKNLNFTLNKRSPFIIGIWLFIVVFLLTNVNLFSQCIQGDCIEGKGIYRFPSDATFTGNFHGGKLSQGIYKYPNGDTYVGGFLNNKREGYGEYRYASGNYFKGTYKGGDKVEGVFYYKDGSMYTGAFKAGLREGKGTLVISDSIQMIGFWLEDEFVGLEAKNQIDLYAVIVGVSKYKFSSSDLRYSANDASMIHKTLRQGHMGRYIESNVKVLLDDEATESNIIKAMTELFRKADSNDRIVFYFSGHGIEGHFLASDAMLGGTGLLSHRTVLEILDQSPCENRFVFADACFAGSFDQRIKQENFKLMLTNQKETYDNTMFMLSCKSEEFSMEHPVVKMGVFTFFLNTGIKGYADANRDHLVDVAELFNYTSKNTQEFVYNATGRQQNPIILGEYSTTLIVSKSKNLE